MPTIILSSVLCFFLQVSLLMGQDKMITVREFLDNPVGFSLSIDQISKNETPSFKLKRYNFIKRPTDTIYRFNYKKSEFFFHKPLNHDAVFFSGIIYNSQIILNNNIHIGMDKKNFISKISDLSNFDGDNIEIKSAENPLLFNFYFKNDKLVCIKIKNRSKNQ